jgi:hypothetical protein
MTQVSTAITIGAVIVIAGGITMGFEAAFTLGCILVIAGIGLAVVRRKVTR